MKYNRGYAQASLPVPRKKYRSLFWEVREGENFLFFKLFACLQKQKSYLFFPLGEWIPKTMQKPFSYIFFILPLYKVTAEKYY